MTASLPRALRFVAFDARNLAGTGRQVAVAVLFAVVVAVVSPLPLLAVPAAAAMASLSVSYPFAMDERGDLDRLYAVLPLRRRDVVAGRYVTMITLYLALTVVAVLAVLVVSPAKGVPVDAGQLGGLVVAGFVAVAVALAVQLPAFFRYGFTRARPMAFLPVLLLAVGAYLLVTATGAADVLTASVTGRAGALTTAAGVLAVMLLTGSAALSTRWYRHRAL